PRLRIFVTWLGLCALLFAALAVLQYHDLITLPEQEPEAVIGTGEMDRATARARAEAAKYAYVKETEYDPESGQMVEFRRLRGTGIFRDPNDICLLLTMGLFIALYGATDTAQGALRLAWVGPILFF